MENYNTLDVDKMYNFKTYGSRRMQIDMRKAVDDKIAQGFDVVKHDTRIIMKRGGNMLELIQLEYVVVKKYEE